MEDEEPFRLCGQSWLTLCSDAGPGGETFGHLCFITQKAVNER